MSGIPGDPKNPPSKFLENKLTPEEIEAWNMWVYRSHGIQPNQFHYFYDDGQTILYPEHIRDLIVISTMWSNKQKALAEKEKSKAQAKNHPVLGRKNVTKGGGFFGKTYRYQ